MEMASFVAAAADDATISLFLWTSPISLFTAAQSQPFAVMMGGNQSQKRTSFTFINMLKCSAVFFLKLSEITSFGVANQPFKITAKCRSCYLAKDM